jgi:N-acetylglucosaminyldiphosphoundecaprenol N-acetyl-beta-D-mannosaminyltransferase
MQRSGLEWGYRLAREPRRLWRRYARYNPRFVAAFAMQYLQERSRLDRAPPSDERR